MPTLQISEKEIYKLVDQLDIQKKIELFDYLSSQLLSQKWNMLLTRIDKKLATYPISEKEIRKEVERARKEFAASRG